MSHIFPTLPAVGDSNWGGPLIDGIDTVVDGVNALDDRTAALEANISARYLVAPLPSGDTTGATDQAALQPLLTQAQNANGVLLLQRGIYYVTGLSTAAMFNQPRIHGPGRDYCSVVGTSGTSAAAIRMNGGSGRSSGGGIQDVTISNPGGTALQLADVTSTMHYRLVFKACTIGVNFHIAQSAGFCEFNVVYDSDYRSDALTAVRYTTAYGNSFHGSGIDGNTTINNVSSSTTPMIQIDAGCLPYQAPLTFTAFPRTTVPVIRNLNTGGAGAPQFYGTIKIEGMANSTIGGSNRIHFDGHVQGFGATGLNNGTLVLTEQTYYSDGGVLVRRKPYAFSATKVANSATIITGVESGQGQLIDVFMSATNYAYRYLLYVSHNPYDGDSGQIFVLATHVINNAAGYGAVSSWTVNNYKLLASGTGFPTTASSTINATGKVTVTGETFPMV